MAIQFLRGTKSTLSSSNQIFLAGQPVFESDSGQLKIGDGVNSFSNLPYVGEGLSSGGGSTSAGTYHSVDSRTAYIDVTENYRIVIRRNLTTVNQDKLDEIHENGMLPLTYSDGSRTDIFYRERAYNSSGSSPVATNSAIQPYLYDKVPFAAIQIGTWQGQYDFSDTSSQLISRLSGGVDFKFLMLSQVAEFDADDPDIVDRIAYEGSWYIASTVRLPAYFTTTSIIHTFKS